MGKPRFSCFHCLAGLLVCLALSACSSGAKVRKEERALTVAHPITSGNSPHAEAYLDWVIVRNGPGSWADDADWDEYLMRIKNTSNQSMRVTSVAVHDSLHNPVETVGVRPELVKGSRRTIRRYDDENLQVEAGVGGTALIAAGSASYVAATATATAVITGSAAATTATATGAVVGAFVVAPILVISGSLQNARDAKVAEIINERQTSLPLILAPGESKQVHFFFPLAPSPRKLEIVYQTAGNAHPLVVDTREALRGLHIGDAGDEG